MKTLLLAEIDPVQIIIIVIAMLGGFFQWLWNLIQQSRAEAEQRRNTPALDPEEIRRRQEAWKKQTQARRQQMPQPQASPPPVHDPFSTVRELFEEIKRETAEARRPVPSPRQAPTPPPPLPPTARKAPVQAEFQSPQHAPAALQTPLDEHQAFKNPVESAQLAKSATEDSPSGSSRPAWEGLLASPATLRQAFIFREILGPPKALQSATDSAA